MLNAHAPELPAGIDEGGLEVGWLTTLDGSTELRPDIRVYLRGQQMGDLATDELGIQFPGRSFRRRVDVHEPASDVVQGRGHDKAVDQPWVGSLQEIAHRVPMVNRRSPRVNVASSLEGVLRARSGNPEAVAVRVFDLALTAGEPVFVNRDP